MHTTTALGNSEPEHEEMDLMTSVRGIRLAGLVTAARRLQSSGLEGQNPLTITSRNRHRRPFGLELSSGERQLLV